MPVDTYQWTLIEGSSALAGHYYCHIDNITASSATLYRRPGNGPHVYFAATIPVHLGIGSLVRTGDHKTIEDAIGELGKLINEIEEGE